MLVKWLRAFFNSASRPIKRASEGLSWICGASVWNLALQFSLANSFHNSLLQQWSLQKNFLWEWDAGAQWQVMKVRGTNQLNTPHTQKLTVHLRLLVTCSRGSEDTSIVTPKSLNQWYRGRLRTGCANWGKVQRALSQSSRGNGSWVVEVKNVLHMHRTRNPFSGFFFEPPPHVVFRTHSFLRFSRRC